jgi:hypothetical protein
VLSHCDTCVSLTPQLQSQMPQANRILETFRPPGFDELSPDEKLEYIQALWDHFSGTQRRCGAGTQRRGRRRARLRCSSGDVARIPRAEPWLKLGAWYSKRSRVPNGEGAV